MKQLQTRLVFIIFSIFFTGWLICGLSIWSLEFNKAKKDILRTAGILLDTAAAVRDYTSNQVQPQFDLIEAGLKVPVADQAVQGGNNQAQGYQPTEEKEVPEFNRVTVPSYAAQQVLNQLEKNKVGYSYRETAINPTNRKDLAAPWELEIINYFAANPKAPPKIATQRNAPQSPSWSFFISFISLRKNGNINKKAKPCSIKTTVGTGKE